MILIKVVEKSIHVFLSRISKFWKMCIYFQFHLMLVNVERVSTLYQSKDMEKMNCLGHSTDVAKCPQKIETSLVVTWNIKPCTYILRVHFLLANKYRE